MKLSFLLLSLTVPYLCLGWDCKPGLNYCKHTVEANAGKMNNNHPERTLYECRQQYINGAAVLVIQKGAVCHLSCIDAGLGKSDYCSSKKEYCSAP
ncbi:hypothetical protein BDV59DRAFT_184987 [Aspergillus ambiguus]|uniref:uncharacterized protein n=1 Tax=Aspergillus ambiguus TaxID=176160 RepID=UPI003CCD1222